MFGWIGKVTRLIACVLIGQQIIPTKFLPECKLQHLQTVSYDTLWRQLHFLQMTSWVSIH